MSGNGRRREIRRVTALVESGKPAADLLATAADFAARLHTEVHGLLFEDPNLRRFAKLEVARIVSRFAAAGPVAPGDVLALVEQLAEQARAELRTAAQSLGLAWSFEVVSQAPGGDLRTAFAPHDLLVVELDRNPTAAQARQAATLWSDSMDAAISVLVIRGRMTVGRPAVLVASSTERTAWAMRVAADLLPARAAHLDVMLACREVDSAALASWVRQEARLHGWRVHVNFLADESIDTIARTVRHAAVDLLVVPTEIPGLADRGIEPWIEKLECALLLLR